MRIPFESSVTGTFGLNLQLQVIDPVTWELAPRGSEIVSNLILSKAALRRVRSGARQDFIEIVSSEHEHPVGLLAQMQEIKQAVIEAAASSALCVSGGASHPVSSRGHMRSQIAESDGLASDVDGSSADPGSFYGMKVHIGVRSGDEAVSMIHRLTPYVPHLIALSASSPFAGGADSGWASARLQAAQRHAAQRSLPAAIRDWADYEQYLASMFEQGAFSSDDLPWDLRLRPDLGAVEVSVMDAPLTLERACALAGFVQALAQWVSRQDSAPEPDSVRQAINRQQACLAALDADHVKPGGDRVCLRQDVLQLLGCILPVADEIGSLEQMDALANQVEAAPMDVDWLRAQAGISGDHSSRGHRSRDHGSKDRRSKDHSHRNLGPRDLTPTDLSALVQSMVGRFEQTPVQAESDSDRWTLAADRLQTDTRLGAMFANRSSPRMSVADFNRQL